MATFILARRCISDTWLLSSTSKYFRMFPITSYMFSSGLSPQLWRMRVCPAQRLADSFGSVTRWRHAAEINTTCTWSGIWKSRKLGRRKGAPVQTAQWGTIVFWIVLTRLKNDGSEDVRIKRVKNLPTGVRRLEERRRWCRTSTRLWLEKVFLKRIRAVAARCKVRHPSSMSIQT